jgi:DNA-binding response OmpR family regulator
MNDKPVVLVVDDEEKILELLKSYLEASGWSGLCAKNGHEGMALFEERLGQVSLILLDLMLPDFSGEELCRKIRRVSDIPIIMMTAKVDEESIINGLKIGADDYVTKPFSPRQLMARVEAALRRAGKGGKELVYEDLVVDTEKRSVSLNHRNIALTRDEYNILALLISRQTKIFTREEILEHIKSETYDGFDRSIDTHIKNIRAKLNDDPKSPKYIATVYGMGYRFGSRL